MASVQDLTTQLEAARTAERLAAIARVEEQNRSDRELKVLEHGAAAELRGLRDKADRAFAIKATPSRPAPELRGIARKFLHAGVGFSELEKLSADGVFASRFAISRSAGQMLVRLAASGVADDALYVAVDAIEAKGWQLAVERAKVLAGETS